LNDEIFLKKSVRKINNYPILKKMKFKKKFKKSKEQKTRHVGLE
jgi:hypothetical protein